MLESGGSGTKREGSVMEGGREGCGLKGLVTMESSLYISMPAAPTLCSSQIYSSSARWFIRKIHTASIRIFHLSILTLTRTPVSIASLGYSQHTEEYKHCTDHDFPGLVLQ